MGENISLEKVFDYDACKCASFLDGLKKCTSREDIVKYVDSIVDGFNYDNIPETIVAGNLYKEYVNDGEYRGFIHPSIKIVNNNIAGFTYHIYDREYLYNFANSLKNFNLSNDDNLILYVMRYLDFYFGFPKDDIDGREDILYNYALKYAEEFYKKNNIPIDEDMGAVNQMQLSGDFPLSAFKGTNSALCVERSALAQNIMKLCGLDSSIMYGDCVSRGKKEAHCWNSIYDKDGNILIVDFSNIVYCYKDGCFFGRCPYLIPISKEDLLNNDVLEVVDYHYENGKRVKDNENRKYAIGRTLNIQNEVHNLK